MPTTHHTLACLTATLLTSQAFAQEQRVDVEFAFEYNANFGEAVYVLGSTQELGAWDMRKAIKLEGRDSPNWQVRVSLPVGQTYEYLFIKRETAPGLLGNPQNGMVLSSIFSSVVEDQTQEGSPPVGQVPVGGDETNKRDGNKAQGPVADLSTGVVFESDMVEPVLHYRPAVTALPFQSVPMTDIGNGRTPGEYRWAALGLEDVPNGYDFFIRDQFGNSYPEAGFLTSEIRALYIRDGEFFNEIPPYEESEPRLLSTRTYYSEILGESRGVRILLPRNYGMIPGKRYPVVYMHDGQGLFGGGGSWQVEQAVTEQVELGNMREVIVVGIDNTGHNNRFRDYVPNGDGSVMVAGDADAYTAFIREELKPQIDAEFMTIDDPSTTASIGSSLGAVCAMYQGVAHGDVFRRVGAFSGAWPFSAGFNQTLDDDDAPMQGLRVYIDSGDAGPSSDNFFIVSGIRDVLLDRDQEGTTFSIERNLRYVVGYGDQHNQHAWARRLPGALAFLYPPNEDALGFTGLIVQLRGDVNSDGSVDADDLIDFEAYPPMDIDNDGLAGTESDYHLLEDLVLKAGNGSNNGAKPGKGAKTAKGDKRKSAGKKKAGNKKASKKNKRADRDTNSSRPSRVRR